MAKGQNQNILKIIEDKGLNLKMIRDSFFNKNLSA